MANVTFDDSEPVMFISVENMINIIRGVGISETLRQLADFIEEDFRRWDSFFKIPRVAAHSDNGVIELMPTADGHAYGLKYVNGHPANVKNGYQTVTAFGVLSRVHNGYPVLFSEMTLLTGLRTAAMSALAAKYLAPQGAKTLGIIGNGAQCEFQCHAFQTLIGIERVQLFDIDPEATEKAASNLASSGLELVRCSTAQEAVAGAHIITTCTADKQYATILTDNMVGSGIHINAIGGDSPGKTELHPDILQRADIFVEFEPQTRIEGEIQQLPDTHEVQELWQVIAGEAKGRTTPAQITLFDSVGFAIEDFSALRFVHEEARKTGFFDPLDILATPEDTRNLYGLLQDGHPSRDQSVSRKSGNR